MEEKEGAVGAHSAPQVPSPRGLCSQPPSCSVSCPGILWEPLVLQLCFGDHPSPLYTLLATGVLSPHFPHPLDRHTSVRRGPGRSPYSLSLPTRHYSAPGIRNHISIEVLALHVPRSWV